MTGPWTGWEPPEGVAGWSDFHWWKIAGGRALQLIIVSESPLGYSGHFTKGRMGPCYGEGCQLCHEGIGSQLRYLFAAVEPTTRRLGIWDVGRSVAMEIRDAATQRGSLRGLWIVATHHSHSKQSRTELEILTTELSTWVKGIEAPDVGRALVETWRKAGFAIPEGYEKKPARAAGKNAVASKISTSLKGSPSGVR